VGQPEKTIKGKKTRHIGPHTWKIKKTTIGLSNIRWTKGRVVVLGRLQGVSGKTVKLWKYQTALGMCAKRRQKRARQPRLVDPEKKQMAKGTQNS